MSRDDFILNISDGYLFGFKYFAIAMAFAFVILLIYYLISEAISDWKIHRKLKKEAAAGPSNVR